LKLEEYYTSHYDIDVYADEDHLTDIMEEVLDIKSMFFALGRSLRLRNDDLEVIRTKYPNKSDHEQALNDVLLLWLKKEYNVGNFGLPTWRMLVEAVNKRSGGNNYELAKQIALNHQTGRVVMHAIDYDQSQAY
jgi:hypothetical protein